MTRPALVAITLARKPCSEGTVAANVLKHGCGALNIDASRIGYGDDDDVDFSRVQRQQHSEGVVTGAFGAASLIGTTIPTYKPGGRWPANMVLQHQAGCTPEGACAPGCIVADLDGQDATQPSQFFLNIAGVVGSNALPSELIEYLRTLSTLKDGECLVLRDLEESDLSGQTANRHHSIITRGEPTEEQAADLLRILKPGGHLFLCAPESRPTGHVGACRVEDAGFEIRDCILWARDGGSSYYVPKPSTAEREAGLAHFPDKMFAPSGGAQNALAAAEDAGEGDDAEYGGDGDIGLNRITKRKNAHPTIKPKALMAKILRTVPADNGPIVDPFMGSGTTMLACLETGHDGIGIEREAEYLEIADARVRYWDSARAAWDAATIVSDHVADTTQIETTLEDLLGL